jgi:hypothetical protein
MEHHERMIQSHLRSQVWLLQQIRLLKAGRLSSGGSETQTGAVIRRTERQVADLDRVIARLREKSRGTNVA